MWHCDAKSNKELSWFTICRGFNHLASSSAKKHLIRPVATTKCPLLESLSPEFKRWIKECLAHTWRHTTHPHHCTRYTCFSGLWIGFSFPPISGTRRYIYPPSLHSPFLDSRLQDNIYISTTWIAISFLFSGTSATNPHHWTLDSGSDFHFSPYQLAALHPSLHICELNNTIK